MRIRIQLLIYTFAICFLSNMLTGQTTIVQSLEVVTNDMTAGGNFQVQLKIKGTNLPSANTLGSATIDIEYDNTKLTFVNATNWAFGSAQGYSRSATDNTTFVRVLILGSTVNADGGGVPPGFDITTSNATWVQLNFTIADVSGTTNLTVDGGSNAIGLFENHQNEPNTGVINDQSLSSPNELNDVTLPVELTTFQALAKNNEVMLKWATESEVNNLGFEVFRSYKENDGFEVISSYQSNPALAGQGNSNTQHDYAFTDQWVVAGQTYWYQLADIDYNGVRTFHDPVSITLSLNGEGISSVSPDIPTRFKLYPNYPNPFNPETVLRFDIPQLSGSEPRAQIIIFNSLGQVARKLYNGSLTAGTFEITWNGKNEMGNNLPSGVYYAMLNVGYFTKTIKLVLVR